ncbi:MAG: hypothetical protein FWD67_11360, partial [Betaproteobacteria bacterium]|nr:hypothetical protein [Betaproteobacteria bacterium]
MRPSGKCWIWAAERGWFLRALCGRRLTDRSVGLDEDFPGESRVMAQAREVCRAHPTIYYTLD